MVIIELGNNFIEKNFVFLNGNYYFFINLSCKINNMVWFKVDIIRFFWMKLF